MVTAPSDTSLETYEGQFGPFVITADDRREVVIYRCGLAIAAFSFALGVMLLRLGNGSTGLLWTISGCYLTMWLGLGISLWFIHIYLKPLHQALQGLWLAGGLASLGIAIGVPGPLALTAYEQPLSILGIGFTFAAMTGIFIKEAFCFNRLETKFLVPLVPSLLLTHMAQAMPSHIGQGLLIAWAVLFVIFALRKLMQPIPPDIGDKSVFEHLKQKRQANI
ncbi:DUF2301 domain-containing membrane protein [Leptothoe sp. ISB3NOV94-8A]|uniref:DUF2301 domain-containing membrane protein n=1 Tax=Adonisia turfae CCMR0081 TaxID=2292702 RepID=A0A6M0RFC9_9CYAN|nr:DUF2301 domain-containing membrane protein [Adonisia turfae]MDV3349444.1 DUF2301 domain-containing membrane protein [Leptothoe sp. LEGE 181152]NEZ54915.1 hypothetical protein [Adonisia turfae CCMR0081]